ncbi:DnaD domain protein [Lactococcus allomyrinae]|uniref:DnaD domain protein n=2 Tax=Lactococcus allomyrinae TaxID=2419773 RepID=A0A387BLR4_9LACT|nr:DnaD domain protein [Lactococcus allomyrinae]
MSSNTNGLNGVAVYEASNEFSSEKNQKYDEKIETSNEITSDSNALEQTSGNETSNVISEDTSNTTSNTSFNEASNTTSKDTSTYTEKSKEKKSREEIFSNSDNNKNNKIKKLVSFFEAEFGTISPMQIEELQAMLFEDKYDFEIIKLALREASLNNKRTFNYVKGILRNWRQEGITSVHAVENREIERFEAKEPVKTDFYIPMDGPWNDK